MVENLRSKRTRFIPDTQAHGKFRKVYVDSKKPYALFSTSSCVSTSSGLSFMGSNPRTRI
jgi:hypothetical protein